MRTPLTARVAACALLAGLALAVVPPVSAAAAATTPRPVAYVTTNGALDVIDLQSHSVTPVPGTINPIAVVARPDGKFAYMITDYDLKIIDTSASAVIKAINIPGSPELQGMALSPDGHKIYITDWRQNSVIVVDTATNTVTSTITNIPFAQAPAVSPDGHTLYVTGVNWDATANGTDALTLIDTATGTVTATVSVPSGPTSVAISPDGSRAYVESYLGSLSIVNTATHAVLSTVPLGGQAVDMVVTPDGKYLYLTVDQDVQVFDTTTGAVTKHITVGDPWGLTINADGSQVLVARPTADRVSIINTATNTLSGASSDIHTGAYPEDVVLATVPTITGPTAHLTVSNVPDSRTVTADATTSTGGYAAIGTYAFNFGDGTVLTQSTPTATHTYAANGSYTVSLTVTDGVGQTSQTSAPVTAQVFTRTVALLANNLRYLTAENAGAAPLVANRSQIGIWETIDLVPLGGGTYVLRSHANSAYIRVDAGQGSQLIADASSTAMATPFEVVTRPYEYGLFSLRDKATGRYLSSNNGTQPAAADRFAIGPWEQFYQADLAIGITSLRAKANNHLVTAESAGAKPLIANRSTAGLWESFDVIDAGNGNVALFSRADSRFVTADNSGNSPLIANRSLLLGQEQFKVVWNQDGTFSLLALTNGKYVTAENAGNSPLIANRTNIGDWEKFTNS